MADAIALLSIPQDVPPISASTAKVDLDDVKMEDK